MKRYILALLPATILLAGPVVAPLIDYDNEDIIAAKKEVQEKIILPPATPPVVQAPGVRVEQKKYFTYEFDALAGRNFSDDNSLLKDATTAGIRLNRYITEDFAIQLGYDRIFDADYKSTTAKKNHSARSIPVCSAIPSCEDDDNSGNKDSDKNGENQDTPYNPPVTESGVSKGTKSTDIDRFYLNALKQMHLKNSSFIPYLLAGVGYEHINDKNLDIRSQGFFNAGGGLKYALGKKLRVVSEAKVIKKFKDHDLDIVATLGMGLLFGQKTVNIQNNKNIDNTILPSAQIAPELKEDEATLTHSKPQTAIVIPDDEKIDLMIEETPVIIKDDDIDHTESVEKEENQDLYFIQVAVVSKEKSLNNYLQKIKNNDLDYEIKPVSLTNPFTKRVLVGPYLSKLDAQLDMPIVKEEIEKSAFIKTFKR